MRGKRADPKPLTRENVQNFVNSFTKDDHRIPQDKLLEAIDEIMKRMEQQITLLENPLFAQAYSVPSNLLEGATMAATDPRVQRIKMGTAERQKEQQTPAKPNPSGWFDKLKGLLKKG